MINGSGNSKDVKFVPWRFVYVGSWFDSYEVKTTLKNVSLTQLFITGKQNFLKLSIKVDR